MGGARAGSAPTAAGAGRTRWSAWRSVLAGAVIGFVEAAGSDADRRTLRRPQPLVRLDHRKPASLHCPRGLWFLEPLTHLSRYLSRN